MIDVYILGKSSKTNMLKHEERHWMCIWIDENKLNC